MKNSKILKLRADRAKVQRLAQEKRHRESVDANKDLKFSVDRLHELLNDKEPFDAKKLSEQIDELSRVIDIKDQILELKEALSKSKTIVNTEKIDLSPVIDAIKKNKPEVKTYDFAKFEKAIIEIQQRVQQGSNIPEQAPSDYQPVRRVVKIGNRLMFDDNLTTSVRAGGGGSSSGGGEVTQGTSPWVISGTISNEVTSPVNALDIPLATRIDEASDTVTYIGAAQPGAAAGAASWQIKKVDTSSGTIITFADGDGLFNNVWNNRASLSYS